MILAHPVPPRYRRPLVDAPDPLLRKALSVSVALAFAWLILVWIAPVPQVHETEVDALPERLARLIVEEPRPPAKSPAASAPGVELPPAPVEVPAEVVQPAPPPAAQERSTPRTIVRRPEPVLAEDRGRAGREQARNEVTQQLAQVGAEVDRTLESLASVLPTATQDASTQATPARPGGRAPRAGRSGAAVGGGTTRATTGSASLGSGTLAAGISDLGALGAFDLAGVTGSANSPAPAPASGIGSGDRTAASLLAVVRRCALAQIEAWRFAAAPTASVFDAPFVFRPSD